MHRRASFANLLAPSVVALMLGAGVGGCYDWAPPGSTQAAQNGGGAAAAGTEAQSASSSSSAATSAATGSGGMGGAPDDGATASSSVAVVSATVGVGGGGPDEQACDDGGLCTSCISCALHGACEALADACSADPACASFADCIGYCFDEVCLGDCADAEPLGAELFQEAAQCAVCEECPGDCAGIADWVGCQ